MIKFVIMYERVSILKLDYSALPLLRKTCKAVIQASLALGSVGAFRYRNKDYRLAYRIFYIVRRLMNRILCRNYGISKE